MKNTLLFVTDLGNFKAFRVIRGNSQKPRLVQIESFVPLDAHGKLSEKLTDGAGRHNNGGLSRDMGTFGEEHNLKLELERRIIQHLVRRIDEIARTQSELPVIYLAAHKEINNEILKRLDPEIRLRVEKNLAEDLTKTPQAKLLHHFDHAEVLQEAVH